MKFYASLSPSIPYYETILNMQNLTKYLQTITNPKELYKQKPFEVNDIFKQQ